MQQGNAQHNQTQPENPNNNSPRLGALGNGLKAAWNKTGTLRIAAAASVLTGAVSIHFFNNESDVIDTVFNNNELQITQIDEDTSIITRGDSSAIRYKSLTCPIVLTWPEEIELTLGNTGDATITPSENTSSIDTILGTLGVTRDVQINRKPVDNAQGLMNDFYEYANSCYERMERLRSEDAITSAPPANTNETAPSPE